MKKGLMNSSRLWQLHQLWQWQHRQVAEAVQKLIMGTNAAFPPFEYTTSQGLVGEFDGIDVAIAQ